MLNSLASLRILKLFKHALEKCEYKLIPCVTYVGEFVHAKLMIMDGRRRTAVDYKQNSEEQSARPL